MTANVTPIFPLTPNVGALNAKITSAMTSTKAFEGTDTVGASLALCFTAGANGARVDFLRVKHSSSAAAAPSGTTNATVVHVFLNNGSDNTVAANNQFIGAVAIASRAVTTTAEMPEYRLPLDISIPAGYRLYAGITSSLGGTNCALAISAQGGDY